MFPGLISNFKAFKLLRQNLGHISTVNKHCETASLNCNQAEVRKYTHLSRQRRTPLFSDFKQLNSYCTRRLCEENRFEDATEQKGRCLLILIPFLFA